MMEQNDSINSYNFDNEGYIGASGTEVLDIFKIRIWGIDEVCSFTSYAKGTVYNLVSSGEIPHRKRGRKKRLVFIPTEIIQWFKGENNDQT
jgi:excisionase family DNA binding protein